MQKSENQDFSQRFLCRRKIEKKKELERNYYKHLDKGNKGKL